MVLGRIHDKEVLSLWYGNLECTFALVVEFFTIKEAYVIFINFPVGEIPIESDCKVAVEALLGICVCPWRSIAVFQNVKSLSASVEKVDLLWCPRDCNESAYEALKWEEDIVKTGNDFLFNAPRNVDAYILHDSFVALNEYINQLYSQIYIYIYIYIYIFF